MGPSTEVHDDRISGVICGIKQVTATGEWICIAKPHDTEKQGSSQRDARGNTARSERHYMVKNRNFNAA